MEYFFLILVLLTIPAGVIYAVVQIAMMRRRIDDLQRDIYNLRTEVRSGTPGSIPTAAPVERPREIVSPTPSAPPPPAMTRPAPPPAPILSHPTTPPPSKTPSASQKEWEALVGGKLLNWIGALALVFGVGFFLKYAFDNDWISEPVRVLMGIVVGLGLLVFGRMMHVKSYRIFAQGIVGAGIAILYLSVYASFGYYHLVSQTTAFVGMALVTAIAFYRGLAHNSLAIAILGWLGGFLTPYLLSTGEVHEVGFFTYIGLLVIGVRAITYFRPGWKILEHLSFAGWVVLFIGWFDNYYDPAKSGVGTVATICFWLTYAMGEFFATLNRQVRKTDQLVLSSVNATVGFIVLDSLLYHPHPDLLAVLTLTIGVFYAIAAIVLRNRQTESRECSDQYFVHGIAFLFAATAVELNDYRLITALAGEAIVLSWIGRRWNVGAVRYGACGHLALTFLFLLVIPDMVVFEPIREFSLLINERAVAIVSLTVALLWGARQLGEGPGKYTQTITQSLNAAWCLTIFLLVTTETLDYFRHIAAVNGQMIMTTSPRLTVNLTLSMSWAFLSLLLLSIGVKARSQVILVASLLALELGLLWVLVGGRSYYPSDQFALLFNYRSLAMIFVGICLYWAQKMYVKIADLGNPYQSFSTAARVGLLVLGLWFFTVETWDIFDRSRELLTKTGDFSTTQEKSIANMQQLSLSAVWLVYSGIMMSLGIWRRHRPLRMAAIALFSVTILKIFLWDLAFLSGLYRIFSFIGLGIILLAVSFAYQRFKSLIFEGNAEKPAETQ